MNFNLSFKPGFSFSSFLFMKRLFSSSSISARRVVSSAYLRLSIFLPTILIPACASSSPAFCMMYSACKLNKQGDNIQPWCTPFPIWNQSVVPCPGLIFVMEMTTSLKKHEKAIWNLSVVPYPALTVASWSAYRFLKRQVMWSSIHISFRIFQSLLWSTQSKALT